MSKPDGGSSALFITPEAPYPPVGGGALRSWCLLEFLRSRYEVDVIVFAENAAVHIPGARDVTVLKLPRHTRATAARAWRNFGRFVRGIPPLVDRFSGFDAELGSVLSGHRYDVAVVEHFWCAPYGALLRSHATRLILDLHNVESALSAWTAAAEPWPASAVFRRFASAYRRLEREWLPRFDDVLVPSEDDARRVVPHCAAAVIPNALPLRPQPPAPDEEAVAFSGNLEYHPNVAAVRFFAASVWPRIRAQHPYAEWRLIGRNADAISPLVANVPGVRVIGAVEDAVEELARARVVVAPLLSGSGTRFKILEAWAAGRAVVSTTVGAEGLGAISGEHLLIADGAEAFADAVAGLLDSPHERAELGANGRALYETRFTTEAAWRELERIGL
jgi:glycosyltransferase involved in cell wall biosynthesis